MLQRSKLDELPQFWNILVGDMSLVGPRPESPRFMDCFRDEYLGVLRYQPGLLGPSQVLFRNESALFPKNVDPEVIIVRRCSRRRRASTSPTMRKPTSSGTSCGSCGGSWSSCFRR